MHALVQLLRVGRPQLCRAEGTMDAAADSGLGAANATVRAAQRLHGRSESFVHSEDWCRRHVATCGRERSRNRHLGGKESVVRRRRDDTLQPTSDESARHRRGHEDTRDGCRESRCATAVKDSPRAALGEGRVGFVAAVNGRERQLRAVH
jgi:hypothetical protein